MLMKDGPWAPYEPTAEDPWDLRKVAHLHRRAGFGATWAELQRDLKAGPVASVDRLLRPRLATSEEKQVLEALRKGAVETRDSERLKALWLYRMLYDPDPLREKLTLFWHGHFATSNRKVQNLGLMLRQNELLRRHALGDFSAMLTEIIPDPAMLIWLDGAGSNKEKPNENFAREFLELFTVGIGHYTEPDIRAAARAFTGWGQGGRRPRGGDAMDGPASGYDPAKFDAGEKTFLKQTGPWKPADIVRITLEQPACAEFLCRKLYRFLVREDRDPAPELIGPLAEQLRGKNYAIGPVVETVLRSRHFYGQEAYRQRIKGPVEFSAGLVRTLDVPRADVSLLALAVKCERQGQDLFYPPNVKGWDGGKTWLNSTTVLERGNWVTDVVWGSPDLGLKPFDVPAWAGRQGVAPDKAAEALIDLLLQGDLDGKARTLVLKAGADGKPDGLRKALQLVLNCPEYQLA
jgi:uncharacterized protein (DUF1800 family)